MTPARAATLTLLALTACPGDVATSTTASTDTTGPAPATSTDPTPTSDAPATSDVSSSTTAADTTSTTTDSTTTGGAITSDTTISDTTAADDTTTGPLPACDTRGSPFLKWSTQAAGEPLPGFIAAATATPSGDSVVVGQTHAGGQNYDAFVAVHGPDGALRWTDTYAGVHGLGDAAVDVAVDAHGFIHVLVLEVVSEVWVEQGPITDSRLVILRYAPDGAHVWRWERAFVPMQLPGNHRPGGAIDVGDDTIHLLDGSYNTPRRRVDLDRFGDVLGDTLIQLPDAVEQHKIVAQTVGPDGTVHIGAEYYAGEGDPQPWLGSFALDGALKWSATFGVYKDQAATLVAGGDGSVVLLWRRKVGPGMFDPWMQRHEPDGALAWAWQFPFGPGLAAGALSCDGTTLLAGGKDELAGPDLEWDQRRDLQVCGLNSDGVPRWAQQHAFGPPYSHGGATVVAGAPDGDVIVAGSYLDDDGETYQAWLGRYGFD